MTQKAQIIKSYGRRFIVRTEDGQSFDAITRQKRVDFVCGDWVDLSIINKDQSVVEDYIPRKSLLYRQDNFKTKLIAANVTQLVIVVAAVPTPNEELIQRALIAAEAAEIQAAIVLNKSDLPETAKWQEKLEWYQSLGYPVIVLSALENIDPLRKLLKGHTSILLGQSGMGKSTLTNALLGGAVARVGDISSALDSGKHTTTNAELFDLEDDDTFLIDSPGLQEFGLKHLDAVNLIHYFPDLRGLIGQCRFHNCTHRQEPNCALKAAALEGLIKPERLAFLQRLMNELI